MKSKISLLLISTLYYSNSNSLLSEENSPKPQLSLLKPLKPRNIDIIYASSFLKEDQNTATNSPEVISALIKSKVDDDKYIEQINSLMTLFSFESGSSSSKDLNEPAKPKTSKLYAEHVFPNLIDTICKTEPQSLILKTAWQILNTMPSLYDTFDAKGGMEGSLTNGKQIEDYINLIIKVVQTEFHEKAMLLPRLIINLGPEKDVLLTRLIRNLGTDEDFLDLIDEKISEHEIFKNQIKNVADEYKQLADLSEDTFKHDGRVLEIAGQINLIHKKIVEFKHEIEMEKLEQRLNKKIVLKKTFGASSSTKEEKEEVDSAKQED